MERPRMSATDQVLARMVGEIEDRQQFIDSLVQAANDDKADLSPEKLELVERAKNRIGELNVQMKPLEEARRISSESTERIAQLARFMSKEGDKPTEMEYRSAGAYI